ncbi:endonuclease [Caudoviricetes sp.]|nr:endonuclease [Caudoviricetes sp.]
MDVDQEWLQRLRDALTYDSTTGEFRWTIWRGANAKAGSIAGGTDSKGHRQIRFEMKLYGAHRLAWVMTHGRWPDQELDHINRDRSDNRLLNLRECSHAENSKNRSIYSSNTSGIPGVSWYPKLNKWVAWITSDGKRKHLGYFANIGDAAAARQSAEAEIYGDFRPVQVIGRRIRNRTRGHVQRPQRGRQQCR